MRLPTMLKGDSYKGKSYSKSWSRDSKEQRPLPVLDTPASCLNDSMCIGFRRTGSSRYLNLCSTGYSRARKLQEDASILQY